MTKIKNTKKGMAKKTLSISLAVAMLATSNVPVWAAEFTDGTDAVFTSEVEAPVEVVDEAPVVEETVEAPSAKSEVSGEEYTATLSPMTFDGKSIVNNEFVWENNKFVETTLTVADNKVITGATLKAAWKVNGVVDNSSITPLTLVNNKAELPCKREITSNDATNKLALYVYAEKADGSIVWNYTSDEVTVSPKDTTKYVHAEAEDVKYTGKINKSQPVVYSDTGVEIEELKYDSDHLDNYIVGYDEKVDLVNVTDKEITITLTPTSKAYKGSIVATYKITPQTLASESAITGAMKATLKNPSIKYKGGSMTSAKVKKTDIELIDKESKADLSNYLAVDKNGYVDVTISSGKTYVDVITGIPADGTYKNYNVTATTDSKAESTNVLEILDRDLSSVNVTIDRQKKDNNVVSLEKEDVHFNDKETGEPLNLWDDVIVTVPTNAVEVGSYTVVVTPKTTQTKVKGQTTGTLYIYASDVNDTTFKKNGTEMETVVDGKNVIGTNNGVPKYYTGEAVTFSVDEIGLPTVKGTNGAPLRPEDYEITYLDNTNAGTAQMLLVGKSSYVNSLKRYQFTISQTPVSSVDASKYVEKISDHASADDYKEAMGIVVKATVPRTNKVLTLVEGKDYTVSYKFAENKTKVEATVKLNNNGNFDNDNNVILTKTANIVRATLKAENIKLKENSFTYNGQAIEPDFDVVIGGHIISKDDNFNVEYIHNVDAGKASIVVSAKENGDYKGTATVDFTINPAKAEDLVGVIGSKNYTGYSIEVATDDIDLTLGGKKIDVAKDFSLTFGENVKVGEGTVTLTPCNKNFTGTKTLTFKIVGEELAAGTFKYIDENGFNITGTAKESFTYNGKAQKFAKTVLNHDKSLKEGTDYEIVYADNVYGQTGTDKEQYVAVLAVAKGKYGGMLTTDAESPISVKNGVYTDANGNKIVDVFTFDLVPLGQLDINKSNVSVSNGTYAAGLPVKPEVKIVVQGRTLVEGVDYDLDLKANKDIVNATEKKSLVVSISAKNGYKAGDIEKDGKLVTWAWGIDKFDLADADVTVSGENVTVMCKGVVVAPTEYTVEKNGEKNTVTVTATKDNKNYKGSKTVSAVVITPEEKPETPMITEVKVVGNKATVILSGETEGATGYDYVISTDKDCITNKDYDKVNKNVLNTDTTFTYVQQDVYYAYCHAWKRGADGKKVFSDWSSAYPFVVSAITPAQPGVTSVKVKGSTVTVTYTKSSNADGYDVVLGSKVATVAGEKRPVEYGTLVKKNIKGNTVTATFKNVKKGTYYVGLHAFNRTSEDGKKVFSPWSNVKKVTVK